jgi:hypothetical protein
VILKQTTTKDQIFARMNKKKTESTPLAEEKKTHTHTHKSQNLFKISLLDSTHAQASGKRKLKK